MSDDNSTDLSRRIRALAEDPMWSDHVENVSKKTLVAAAEEIERYYVGMANWKKTAEEKDSLIVRMSAADKAELDYWRQLHKEDRHYAAKTDGKSHDDRISMIRFAILRKSK